VPGCADLELLTTAPVMGVRDSRRIVGEFELNIEDFRAKRQFPDQIAVYNRPTDVHPTDTSKAEFDRFMKDFHGKDNLGRRRLRGHPLQHPGAARLAQPVGGRALPFQRHQGAWLDPRAVGRVHDGAGRGHGGSAVHRHRAAGL
jgi:hypothetical protein